MELSAPNNGATNTFRGGAVTDTHAPAAPLPRMADPVVIFLPAPPSPGDLQHQAKGAPPHNRRQPRRDTWAAIGPAGRHATPAREYAYMRLKTLVLCGRFPPGQRLAEVRLARDLGISRTPIREALHKLQSEGLITPLPRRGFAAPCNSDADVEELRDLRAALEGYALRVICTRLTEPQLRRLEDIVRRAEDAVAAQHVDDASRWNVRFYAALHALIRDKRRIFEQLVTMQQMALRSNDEAPPELAAAHQTAESHRRILTALRMRDPDLCERAMREHIRRWPGNCSRRERTAVQPGPVEDRLNMGMGILGPR